MVFVWIDLVVAAFIVGIVVGWTLGWRTIKKADLEWAEAMLCPDCLIKWKHGDAEELRDMERLEQVQALGICKRMKHRGWDKRFSYDIYKKLGISEDTWRQIVEDFTEQELFSPWVEISCIGCSASVLQLPLGKAVPSEATCEFCGKSFNPTKEIKHERWYCFTDKLRESMMAGVS